MEDVNLPDDIVVPENIDSPEVQVRILRMEMTGMFNSLLAQLQELRAQQAKLVASHNEVGQNVAWLVANTQGIFQMFSDPQFINNMMGGLLTSMSPGKMMGEFGAPGPADQ